jgi:hypothetical protein
LVVKMPSMYSPKGRSRFLAGRRPGRHRTRGQTSKTGIGGEGGTQFVPGTRAYSAHNRLHVNAPTRWRFAQSYIIHHPFGVRTNDQQRHKRRSFGGSHAGRRRRYGTIVARRNRWRVAR